MSLYIGIDIGKTTHVAAILSPEILSEKHFNSCPLIKITQERASFVHFLQEIQKYGQPEDCHVLLESTGHYSQALEQFMQDCNMRIYKMQARGHYGRDKTDELDARAMAVLLYNQECLHAPVIDERRRIHPMVPPNDEARKLRRLIRHRYELVTETGQRKNRLTSIADEIFPELTQIYIDPNSQSALALREKFPTPQDVAEAHIDDLCATRMRTQPSRVRMLILQDLARTTIGSKDQYMLDSLQMEQGMLITELKLLDKHLTQLDAEIESIVALSREGRILASFVGSGPTQAAVLLAYIGNIANFETASKLKGYVGWAPRKSQTGTSQDSIALARTGNAMLKRTLYLITMSAVKYDPTWKKLYLRLVERKCPYDARTKKHRGKMKVLGRIAGQIVQVMFLLLKKDHDLITGWTSSEPLPPPELYSTEKHIVGKAGER